MARPVAIRASWNNDAAFLLRLEGAIVQDQVQTEEWKRVACELCRKLAQHFLTAKANAVERETKKR
jgi:hypothetical protein